MDDFVKGYREVREILLGTIDEDLVRTFSRFVCYCQYRMEEEFENIPRYESKSLLRFCWTGEEVWVPVPFE